MLKAFWTWNPVSSGKAGETCDPENGRWFFDKSVWQKMFRAMSGCGFDALVLANAHPFPFMIDTPAYPEARMVDESALSVYQAMHHWIFETALDYDIASYPAFLNIHEPAPADFAIEYTGHCLRTVLETYPEISGFVADMGGIDGDTTAGARFVQQAILDTMDAARPDAAIYLRGFTGDPGELAAGIHRRGNHPIHYIAPYTHCHLVGTGGDAAYRRWQEAVGPEFLLAEMDFCNFEPWTSFSYDTVEDILDDLKDTNSHGFLMHPLSEFEWPHTSDTFFTYQWQRDLLWYKAWGGTGVGRLPSQGQPKWLPRNQKLIPGFTAGSRILELMSLYVAGDKSCGWRPQFCSIAREDGSRHLLSIADMLSISADPAFSSRQWWEEVTGDAVIHLEEYLRSGTSPDAYGPDELIEELADLSEQAVTAGEKGMRSASGEKELPSFARDALCMGRLGEFYVERLRAALARARGEDAEALEHMARALGLYREIRAVDSSHRTAFRIRGNHWGTPGDFLETVKALESEYADAGAGRFERGTAYRIGV